MRVAFAISVIAAFDGPVIASGWPVNSLAVLGISLKSDLLSKTGQPPRRHLLHTVQTSDNPS